MLIYSKMVLLGMNYNIRQVMIKCYSCLAINGCRTRECDCPDEAWFLLLVVKFTLLNHARPTNLLTASILKRQAPPPPHLLSSLWGRANFWLSLATLAYSWVVGEDRQRAYYNSRENNIQQEYTGKPVPSFAGGHDFRESQQLQSLAHKRIVTSRRQRSSPLLSPDRGSRPSVKSTMPSSVLFVERGLAHSTHQCSFWQIRTIHTTTSLYKGLLVCDFGQTAASLRVQNDRRSCKNQKN